MRPAILLLTLALLGGCSGGGSTAPAVDPPPPTTGGDPGTPTPPPVARSFVWTDDAWVQAVPDWGSPVRLSLPAPVDAIAFDNMTAIGAFGTHNGGHIEGMDHIWLHISPDLPVRSWAAGTVTSIVDMGGGGGAHEYFITIDYGQGLVGKHMEVETPLVTVGQQVAAGEPVAIGLPWREWRSAEFMLMDQNRAQETGYGVHTAVSPFDYLNAGDQAALLERYRAVVTPAFSLGLPYGDSKPWEPRLTNRHILHRLHRGTLMGEWLLADRGWSVPEPVYFDMLTVLDVSNEFGHFQRFAMLDEALYGPGGGDEGTWELTSPGHIIFHGQRTLYALYVLDESGERAQLRIQWQEGSWPAALGPDAALYVERRPVPRREDAHDLGLM